MADETKWEYDPETKEPTNRQRCLWAQAAIDGYRKATGDCEDEADLRDLLADLMHWAAAHDVDFDEQLRMARNNFESEAEKPQSKTPCHRGGQWHNFVVIEQHGDSADVQCTDCGERR